MQKIIIKNFRAIEYAEIELKKVLVLIGEQASGKSTIAKLIYFFKTIQDDFFVQVYESGDTDLEKLIRKRFIEFFGENNDAFEIQFWFNESMSIKFLSEDKTVSLIGDWSLEKVNKSYQFYIKNLKNGDNNPLDQLVQFVDNSRLVNQIRAEINRIFNSTIIDNLYVIAGRNVTVSYSDIFTQYLDSKIQKNLSVTTDSIDEQLMLKFIERVKYIKQDFKRAGSFEALYSNSFIVDSSDEQKNSAKRFHEKSQKILKADYKFKGEVEQLRLTDKNISVSLSDASSGQQEVIRILQDMFLAILHIHMKSFLRIIEEPEAHLFPIAQKELIELLALAVNYQRENQLIIATHSPYILTVFNNLLFANRVVEKNPNAKAEVEAIVEEDFWLKAEDFSAYALGRDKDDDLYCRSIVNEKTGMIQQNYLDEVSEILGARFNALFDIYKKSKSRRRR